MRIKWMMALIAVVMMLSACSNSSFEANMDVPVDDFEATDQNGETVALSDLKGGVWLANFIFTNCKTVCPPMTSNMSDVQAMLKEEGIDGVKIVSFSVDPENDTPDVLKAYIGRYEKADESSWHLLTGYVPEWIKQFAETSFQTLAVPEPDSDQFIHGTQIFLVNQEGTVVKSYDGNLEVPYEEIVADVDVLTSE